jgi:hypothetical protein
MEKLTQACPLARGLWLFALCALSTLPQLARAQAVMDSNTATEMAPSQAASASAAAEEQALLLLDQALTLADEADWKGAQAKLEQARKLKELPNIVFHLARAHLRLQETAPALSLLARFRELAGKHNPNTQEAERLLAEHSAPGRAAPSAPVTPPPARKKVPVGPLVTISSGGVVLLVSLMTGLLAKAAEDELQRNCASNGMCPSKLEAVRDRGERLKLTTNILIGVGAAAVAAGTGWWFLGRRERAPQAQASCSGVGCSVTARLRF